MRRAYCLIREETQYRRDCFVSGLASAGYTPQKAMPSSVDRGDVLVIWNRYGAYEQIADRFEADGGTVIVAENAYVKPRDGAKYCALSAHAHNGRGYWPEGGPERWEALGIELQPWRQGGQHILICPNRHFGMRGGIMPADWSSSVTRKLQAVTNRPIRMRQHPGNGPERCPLEDDLRDAAAVVIWSSSVGVQALIAGVPVICEAPWWICRDAAFHSLNADNLGQPLGYLGGLGADRLTVFRRLAWAQWSLEEISSGEPFRRLVECARRPMANAA